MLKTYTPRFMAVRAVQLDIDENDVPPINIDELAKHIRSTHNVNVFETDEGLDIGNGHDPFERELLAWGDYFVEFDNMDGSVGYEIMTSYQFERQFEEAR